ncbi:MAG: Rne/Rng family ribonuclease, partial [Bacteroidales bacterium]|nr:Rne/Rng family ribonuclease [Bacteroidales bacterium]
MNRELVINVSSSEIVIALLEDKRLVELRKEKKNIQFSVGDIYLGKVKKVMPGLNAAFVNVGYEKDAFLHYLDLGHQFLSFNKFLNIAINSKQKLPAISKIKTEPDIDKEGKISDILTQGQTILVQIAKEPISTKGPRLSSEISIAGRNLVLLPFTDKVSISQKIKSQDEKVRLKRLLQSIKPKNYGVIVRTVAESKKVANFDSELRELIAKWEVALNKIKTGKPPQLIVGELKQTSAILRDMLNSSFNNIFVNDESCYNDIIDYIKTIAPEKQNIVNFYKGNLPIFEQYGVEKQVKAHFGKNVALKKGAYLIIEHTEAFHVVDVNSGNRTQSGSNQEANAVDVNLLAAEEIARQLRLRDMGGIIVIDFIDMHNFNNRQLLFDKMKELMSNDRAKHHILTLSKFGLMQIT